MSNKLSFGNRIVLLGFGAVARCTLPVLLKHIEVPLDNITILDFDPNEEALKPWTSQGIHFQNIRITPENLATVLGKHLSKGDLLIDLAWNIDCCEIVSWCHDHGVLYVNTSVELWDPYEHSKGAHPTELTLYWRHMNLRRMKACLLYTSPSPRD